MPAPRKGETKEQARARRLREKKAGGTPGPDLEKIASEPATAGAKAPAKAALETALRNQKRVMAQAVAVPFKLIARRRGPHWELDEAEKLELGEAVTECMIAYLPDDVAKHFPLIYLGASLAAIVSKRLEGDEKVLVLERAAMETGAVN